MWASSFHMGNLKQHQLPSWCGKWLALNRNAAALPSSTHREQHVYSHLHRNKLQAAIGHAPATTAHLCRPLLFGTQQLALLLLLRLLPQLPPAAAAVAATPHFCLLLRCLSRRAFAVSPACRGSGLWAAGRCWRPAARTATAAWPRGACTWPRLGIRRSESSPLLMSPSSPPCPATC